MDFFVKPDLKAGEVVLSRKLKEDFFQQAPKGHAYITLNDWNELKKEVLELRLQVKNSHGSSIFLYSKMIKIFDRMKNHLDQMKKTHTEFKSSMEHRLNQFQKELALQKEDKEQFISEKVKDFVDQHHKLSQKYSYQLEDLCQSLTHQSEQVWQLADQVQEIKKGLSTSSPP